MRELGRLYHQGLDGISAATGIFTLLADRPEVVDVIREHIEIVDGVGGPKARIAGKRIRVQDVAIWHEKMGLSPDEIVDAYPTLTENAVQGALRELAHEKEAAAA